MTLPDPLTMWQYVGAGRQAGTFYLPALVSGEEIVAVQYQGECMFLHAPIAPDFSWAGSVVDFYANFKLV